MVVVVFLVVLFMVVAVRFLFTLLLLLSLPVSSVCRRDDYSP